nr:hypothetical protein [Tanacetum cinerariifolium]
LTIPDSGLAIPDLGLTILDPGLAIPDLGLTIFDSSLTCCYNKFNTELCHGWDLGLHIDIAYANGLLIAYCLRSVYCVIIKANRLILMPTLCRKMTKLTKIPSNFTDEIISFISMLEPFTYTLR